MTLSERLALMRQIIAQIRVIRARMNPLVLSRARQRAEAPLAKPALRAAALRCLAEHGSPLPGQTARPRRRPG